MLFLKGDRAFDPITVKNAGSEEDEGFSGIRCPLCAWQPSASSRWCCVSDGPPEPAFDSCGTVWNTFSTRGQCPGCSHQWQWTTCLRCGEWSRHDAWYVK